MEALSLALTAATLAVTAITVLFVVVVVAEVRDRRRYNRVDFAIDHVGPINDGAYEMFELTNCGTETATRMSMLVTGGLPATAHELRPIVVLTAGHSKRFVLDMEDPLEKSWVLFTYQTVSDRRYAHYVWEPLRNDGQLHETWISARDRTRWELFVDYLKYRFRVVETVGPNGVPGTSVRVARGPKTAAKQGIASKAAFQWLSDKECASTEKPGETQ